jgi:hypothetical protein
MLNIFLTSIIASLLWVQVPQWDSDWSQCAVDVPDVDCHWYVVNPDNTFGKGYREDVAPLFSVEGLWDISKLKNTLANLQTDQGEEEISTPS